MAIYRVLYQASSVSTTYLPWRIVGTTTFLSVAGRALPGVPDSGRTTGRSTGCVVLPLVPGRLPLDPALLNHFIAVLGASLALGHSCSARPDQRHRCSPRRSCSRSAQRAVESRSSPPPSSMRCALVRTPGAGSRSLRRPLCGLSGGSCTRARRGATAVFGELDTPETMRKALRRAFWARSCARVRQRCSGYCPRGRLRRCTSAGATARTGRRRERPGLERSALVWWARSRVLPRCRRRARQLSVRVRRRCVHRARNDPSVAARASSVATRSRLAAAALLPDRDRSNRPHAPEVRSSRTADCTRLTRDARHAATIANLGPSVLPDDASRVADATHSPPGSTERSSTVGVTCPAPRPRDVDRCARQAGVTIVRPHRRRTLYVPDSDRDVAGTVECRAASGDRGDRDDRVRTPFRQTPRRRWATLAANAAAELRMLRISSNVALGIVEAPGACLTTIG